MQKAPETQQAIAARIKELVHLLAKNPCDFASECRMRGVSNIYAVVNSADEGYEGRRILPSTVTIWMIKNRYPQVSMDWLFTGQGKPLLE